MNKRIYSLVFCLFFIMPLMGCNNITTNITTTNTMETTASSEDNSEFTQQLKYIYDLAIEANAFEGTYEEWLESVRGPQGVPGDDGREILLQISEGFIQWQYTGDESWTNLIELEALTGPKGDSGVDGRQVEFQVLDHYIQWRYVDDAEWTNLIDLEILVGPTGDPGADGQEVVFQVSDNHIQWKYLNDTVWIDLVDLDSLVGPQGDPGVSVASFTINNNGELIVTLTDGTTQNLGVIRSYDVIFRTDRGPIYDIVDVNPGTVIETPEIPVKIGYVFLGWFIDEEEVIFPFVFEGDEDLSIYAKWTVNPFEYRVELNNEVTITGYIGDSIDLIIPSEIDGLPVTKIDDYAFQNNTFIETINFEESSNLEVIGVSSFEKSTKLKEVNFPSSLILIDDLAFSEIYTLRTITFHSECSLSRIGMKAFYRLNNLREISLPNQLLEIDEYAFSDNENLETIDFGENTTLHTIGNRAFNNNNSLKTITFPSSLIYIGEYAFSGLSNLRAVLFEEGSQLSVIGENAFRNNELLTRFDMPKTVTEIGNFAFAYNSKLGNIVIPASVTMIGQDAFTSGLYTNDKTIYVQLPNKPSGWDSDWNGGQTIVWNAFDYGTYDAFDYVLTSDNTMTIINYFGVQSDITIPSSINSIVVTKIGARAFQFNNTIENVIISEGIDVIGQKAFYGHDTKLTSVYIPASITRIEQAAFKDKTTLKYLTLAKDSQLEFIGSSAFEFTNITTFIIPDSVTTIQSSAFSNANNITFYAMATSKPITWSSDWNSVGSPVVWGIQDYGLTEDLAYVVKSDSSIAILGQSVISSSINLQIPDTIDGKVVNEIVTRAFMYRIDIKYVYIPDSIIMIGIDAFKFNYSLTIFADAKSKQAGWDVDWNSSDRSVVWGYLETIDDETFIYAKTSLGTASIIGLSELNMNTDIVIPSIIDSLNVNQIINEAFKENTQIVSVTIPNTILVIGEETFSGASSLETVIFETGTQLEEIGDRAFYDAIALNSIVIPETVVRLGDSSFRNVDALELIVIPNSVLEIGDFAFYQCDILVIYAKAPAKPDGWSSSWNASNLSVVWGYIEV